jgi:hypothetical protein
MELDRLLPTYDFRSRYTRRIAADPATVWAALVNLTADDLPITRLLMSVRSAGRTRPRGPVMQTLGPPTLARVCTHRPASQRALRATKVGPGRPVRRGRDARPPR